MTATPHRAPPEFAEWGHYPALWGSTLSWAAGRQVRMPQADGERC
ncbi:hypothetical protein [Pseudonocardia dioxanivorans]|nr:hypothetical protein [Pseudonocardia dioxanivorans]